MWNTLLHKRWYWTIAFLSIIVGVIGLGGGLFAQEGFWMEHWQHKLFAGLCHQDPQRSFMLNGTPMAVCSRCIGIYSSFALAWLIFPMSGSFLRKIDSYLMVILAGAIFINLMDISGNILGFWQNTLTSRYIFGVLLGSAAVLILGRQFIINKHSKNGMNYGTNRDAE